MSEAREEVLPPSPSSMAGFPSSGKALAWLETQRAQAFRLYEEQWKIIRVTEAATGVTPDSLSMRAASQSAWEKVREWDKKIEEAKRVRDVVRGRATTRLLRG